MGMKGHLTRQLAVDPLRSFSSLGDKAGAAASRVCAALESRGKGGRNSVSLHRGQWVGERLQKHVSKHKENLQEKVAEGGPPIPLPSRSALAPTEVGVGSHRSPAGCIRLAEPRLGQNPLLGRGGVGTRPFSAALQPASSITRKDDKLFVELFKILLTGYELLKCLLLTIWMATQRKKSQAFQET